ncbi:MAG TPA: hypothetical protein VLS96_01465 [Nodosilinea sp.]|nr:hypothetical protein [Nodosilinea sp.]
MDRWAPQLRRVPVVMVVCALLLVLWGLRMPGPSGVRCDRASPHQVYCRATLARPWAWLPQASRPFQLQDVAIASELCDNTPRGGVRFCHRLTLLGPHRQLTLPAVRTPLSAAAITEQLQRFIAGEGSPQLSWSSQPLVLPLRTVAIALLLAAAAWGLWDVRWPPAPPLAVDGVPRDGAQDTAQTTKD